MSTSHSLDIVRLKYLKFSLLEMLLNFTDTSARCAIHGLESFLERIIINIIVTNIPDWFWLEIKTYTVLPFLLFSFLIVFVIVHAVLPNKAKKRVHLVHECGEEFYIK